MLSTETPPPDLPLPREISQVKIRSSSIRIDERISEDNQQQQQILLLEVDLSKSGLDDNNNNNPLPVFSMRDYVSSNRAKDIRSNWPFSPKSLQLCLKHGVVDVLPPFQSFEAVKNPSLGKSAVENDTIVADFDEQLPVNFKNVEICLPLDINPVPPTINHLEPEGLIVDKLESSVPVFKKVERNIQNPVKNCKLIVKLNKIGPPGLKEHLAVNSSAASDAMNSKVCPVCKTFSSSSNTTLNAHIDQCLSEVSTLECPSNSKVSKHRIKPRKMKSMVDIYATALHCTLEDLDRRNGTNWASNSSFPAQASEEEHGKDKDISSVGDLKRNNEEGDVYVDSSGTKFVSLSKFSELASGYSAKDDCGARKMVKNNNQRKFPSSKNSMILVKKQKVSKYPRDSQACSSMANHGHEDKFYQQKEHFSKEDCNEEDMARTVKTRQQMKSDELVMTKQQVGSKGAGLRKINHREKKPFRDRIAKNLKVKNHVPSHGDLQVIKSPSDHNSSVFSNENPPRSPLERRKRKENVSLNLHDEWVMQPSIRKRVGLSSLESQDFDGKKKGSTLSKCHLKHSTSDTPSVHEHHSESEDDTENDEILNRSRRAGRDSNPILNADCASNNSRTYRKHALSSAGAQKFSYLRKKLSAMHATVSDLKEKLRRRNVSFKKPRQHYSSESDEETMAPRRGNRVKKLTVDSAEMGKASVHPSTKRAGVLKLTKWKGELMNSNGERTVTSKNSETSSESSESYSHASFGKKIHSSMDGATSESTSNGLDEVKEAEIPNEFTRERVSERHDGEAFTSFSRSLDEHYPPGLLLSAESKIFGADKVAELNIDEGRGNYFVDVDPIPIPGPPGSFLPSPGRISSDEPQGNSSLTTCRIQSSEDKHELVDMDSLNSPVSSSSLESESAAMKSDSLLGVNVHQHSHGVQRKDLCSTSKDRVNPAVENSHPFDASNGSCFQLPEISPRRLDKIQPCCFSRKEGVFESDSLNSQESRLIRQQTITSLPLPVGEKHISDIDEKAYSFNMRPETRSEDEHSLIGYTPTLVSHHSETLSTASNPVFRLMGKDLMVMNKHENLSPQTRPAHLSMGNGHPIPGSNFYGSESAVRLPNEHRFPHHVLQRGPPPFDHVNPSVLANQLVVNQSYDFKTTGGAIGVLGSSSHPATAVLSDKNYGRIFTSSLERHEYADRHNLMAEFGLVGVLRTYKTEEIQTPGPQTARTADFSGGIVKDVNVMDESLDCEAGLAVRRTRGEVRRDARGSTMGICASSMIERDSVHTNTLFSTQTHGYPLFNGFRMDNGPDFQVSSFKATNDDSVTWNYTRNSLTASSPSTGHLRYSPYFDPGFA